MKNYYNKRTGQKLQQFRKYELLKTQEDIAKDLQTTRENISKFENGTNDSAEILIWYLLHGYDIKEI